MILRALLAAAGVALLTAPAAGADRDILWHIVHDQCVPDQIANGNPAPCVQVDLSQGEARGFVVFKDAVGARQYLLMPTAKISGTDDPALLDPAAPNYFAAAWEARRFTEASAGGPLPRSRVSLTVNSASSRSQDQLHIHVDCLRADVHDALVRYADAIGPAWAPLPGLLGEHVYDALKLDAEKFAGVNLFALADDGIRVPQRLALAVVGAGSDTDPGFIVLRHYDDPDHADLAGAENLQDHENCVVG